MGPGQGTGRVFLGAGTCVADPGLPESGLANIVQYVLQLMGSKWD
jgi:hypothetical protein